MFRVGKTVGSIDELLALNNKYGVDTKIEYRDKKRVKTDYINLPIAFDIETSSFYTDGKHTYTCEYVKDHTKALYDIESSDEEVKAASDFLNKLDKHAIMYAWQIGINGDAVIGRTWEELETAMDKIVSHFGLSESRRAIVFVHNLGYEMQWIRKRFNWVNIFAREERKPLKAVTDKGLEFRCSFALSGMSLEKTCENLGKYKVKKMVGDLDHTRIHTPNTKLDNKEKGYCANDVIGLNAYIQEQIEMYGGISKIPITNTARVRIKCRENALNDKNGFNYRKLMQRLVITSVEEYKSIKRAFQGGFAHASYQKAGKIIENVSSWDITSSYPAIACCELFPMTSATHYDKMTVKEVEDTAATKLLIFDVEFKGLFSKVGYEHYLSESRCFEYDSIRADNGRIISALRAKTTITNVDWEIIKQMYEWDEVKITNVFVYGCGYLPKPLIEVILDLYSGKTELKDVTGKEIEYQNLKAMLNAVMGMMATGVVNDQINYKDDKWSKELGNIAEQIERYNKDKKRFLFAPWSCFITAYGRRNLFYAINECKEDYAYSDTDAVKIENEEKHIAFFDKYNEWIVNRLTSVCEFYKIDVDKIRPKNKKGKQKPLGVYTRDGGYTRFKTLGSKRYIYEYLKTEDEDGNPLSTPYLAIQSTIAGVNKKLTSEWLEERHDRAFEIFNNEMEVPAESSGRLTSTYGDDEISGVVTDYKGDKYEYNEKSYIHMENGSYSLSMTSLYLALIGGTMSQGEVDA